MLRLSVANLVALTIALTGCGGGGNGDGDDEGTGEGRIIELTEQGGSGQAGTATLTPAGNSTRVVIELGNSRDEPQPAHIHTGTCNDLGGIEFPLSDVEGGASGTTVEASFLFLSGASDAAFAVDVHKSATDLDGVACGTVSSGMPELNP